LLVMLAGRGMDCRVLTTGILDPERETSLDQVLGTVELSAKRFQAELGTGRAAEVVDLVVNGVRVTVMPTASSRAERSPDTREAAVFLELADQVFDRFRPDVLLTYGGHPASLELMGRARQRGIAVLFHLHNFGCSEPKESDSKNDRRAFADFSTVIFPSEYSRSYHARLLGLDGPVIPDPIPLDRIAVDNPEPPYVTFVNPKLPKGVAVFDRIAIELNRKRPDTPPRIGVLRKSSSVLGFVNRK
jgi:Glycosyl transferase 4-like domain